jgi:hypothetical protein
MDTLRALFGIDQPDDELRALLAAYEDIRHAIEKLRGLDLTEMHPAVVFDPLLPYRGERR